MSCAKVRDPSQTQSTHVCKSWHSPARPNLVLRQSTMRKVRSIGRTLRRRERIFTLLRPASVSAATKNRSRGSARGPSQLSASPRTHTSVIHRMDSAEAALRMLSTSFTKRQQVSLFAVRESFNACAARARSMAASRRAVSSSVLSEPEPDDLSGRTSGTTTGAADNTPAASSRPRPTRRARRAPNEIGIEASHSVRARQHERLGMFSTHTCTALTNSIICQKSANADSRGNSRSAIVQCPTYAKWTTARATAPPNFVTSTVSTLSAKRPLSWHANTGETAVSTERWHMTACVDFASPALPSAASTASSKSPAPSFKVS
mmetsp:Transcript_37307/g.102548  ORF Transcript_37307/g.102548 Transcript_37307/m.102548 type:complete len:319 (+) Transcript_37307:486-1442(+)